MPLSKPPEKLARYRPLIAAFSVARASLLATWRSPTTIVFSVLFPVIFIIVFGAMVDTSAVQIRVDLVPGTDTTSPIFAATRQIPLLDLRQGTDTATMRDDLLKGRTSAVLSIQSRQGTPGGFQINLETSSSSAEQIPILDAAFTALISRYNRQFRTRDAGPAFLKTEDIPGRQYRRIDFILPGQLGFSLLMAGVFGSTFLLFHLRQSNVLKRLSATPLTRAWLILGEMLSRFIFQLLTFVLIVALGYFGFQFTLVRGIWTFLEMLVFSLPALLIFMGTGFIISGMIRAESAIAPIANTIILPQILLCGLFFPVANYPGWLQWICNLLPLTFYVDGLRKIAFEGIHFWLLPRELIGLGCWSLVVSWLAVRLFRWE